MCEKMALDTETPAVIECTQISVAGLRRTYLDRKPVVSLPPLSRELTVYLPPNFSTSKCDHSCRENRSLAEMKAQICLLATACLRDIRTNDMRHLGKVRDNTCRPEYTRMSLQRAGTAYSSPRRKTTHISTDEARSTRRARKKSGV
jgi:hypothetical protein